MIQRKHISVEEFTATSIFSKSANIILLLDHIKSGALNAKQFAWLRCMFRRDSNYITRYKQLNDLLRSQYLNAILEGVYHLRVEETNDIKSTLLRWLDSCEKRTLISLSTIDDLIQEETLAVIDSKNQKTTTPIIDKKDAIHPLKSHPIDHTPHRFYIFPSELLLELTLGCVKKDNIPI